MPARKRTIKLNKASTVAAVDSAPVTPDDTAPLAAPTVDTIAADSVDTDTVATVEIAAPDSVEHSDATDTAAVEHVASTDEISAPIAADTVAPIVAPIATDKPIVNGRAVATEAQSADCRRAAGHAVAAYYSGKSLPFKSAYTKFSDLNFSNAKSDSERQAALLVCLYTYGSDNIQPSGEFIRGNFLVPGAILGDGFDANELYRAQPESGCLGNTLGRVIHFVSGPTSGKNQRDTVLRINHSAAKSEIRKYFGDAVAKIVDTYIG